MAAGVRNRRHELSVGNALCEYVQTPTSNNWSASYSEEQVMVETQESHIVAKDITLTYGSNVVQQYSNHEKRNINHHLKSEG